VDPVGQLMNSILDGVDQGTARVAVIGTSAAAIAAWNKARSAIRRHRPSPNPAEQAVLAAGPGQEVDRGTLLGLLQLLWSAEERHAITVEGDWVDGDKNITLHGGDYVVKNKRFY
jgi:hypothetical protein